MKRKLGLLALAGVVGLGLASSGFGQGPPAGAAQGRGLAIQNAAPLACGVGRGFNCPYRTAALRGTSGTATLGYGMGRGMGMRMNAAFAPGTGPFCPFNPNRANAATAGTAARTSTGSPAFGPGMGMRRNARVAPGTGPFCPFNPNNNAAAAETGSNQPATK